MYRAIELDGADSDLHRFVWRSRPEDTLQEYRMTRVTFGILTSCFTANMAVKQNAIDFAQDFPLAARAVEKSFYVDDYFTGADDIKIATSLRSQLQGLFARGDFLLRKWNSNEVTVLQGVAPELRECGDVHSISDTNDYTKTLGLEWNTVTDQFCLTVSNFPATEVVTKRILVSDIAKVFDVPEWFSPATICMKILLQRLWQGVDWDDSVPKAVEEDWRCWRSELTYLSTKGIPRCYFPMEAAAHSVQLHGFSDASENAYAGVDYLRVSDTSRNVHLALITSKTKVTPIKRCLSPDWSYVVCKFLLNLSPMFRRSSSCHCLTPLHGQKHHCTELAVRKPTQVQNLRCKLCIDKLPPERWNHVAGVENPADCASIGLFPLELLDHSLWWEGPTWLHCHPQVSPSNPIV